MYVVISSPRTLAGEFNGWLVNLHRLRGIEPLVCGYEKVLMVRLKKFNA